MRTTRRGFLGRLIALAAAPAAVGFLPTPVASTVAPRRYVNVLDFGADPTGRRDSSDALRRAIAAAGSGGSVYLPAGTYRA